MQFEPRAKRRIELSWNHGIYLDMWSIIHFITGVIFSAGLIMFDVSFYFGLVIVLTVTILYEGLEVALKIVEDFENSFSDVTVAVIGFVLYFWLFSERVVSFHVNVFVITTLFNSILFYTGWRKYLKRRMKK